MIASDVRAICVRDPDLVRMVQLARLKTLATCFAALPLVACAHSGDFDETGGITVVRSSCPAVAVPAYTGDITLFDPPASRDAAAIDVTAVITNVRSTCTEKAQSRQVSVTFDVQVRRAQAAGARDVVLPYFATVLRAGTEIQSKQIGQIRVHFDDGAIRAESRGAVTANVSAAALSLSPEILAQINRKRRPGDADAALDPMADPKVRAAVSRASYEVLVGFQLGEDQLKYNATR